MTPLARLARGLAALCAFAFLSTSALAQTSYTINPGGSVTLSSADQSGMCGGDMSNRNVSFTNGTVYVLGTNAGGSPISTFKSYIDQGWVVYTHNGDGATVVYITISGDGCTNSRTITVNITQASTAPTVTQHPQNVAVCEGPNIVLRSAASGSPVPTAQWQRSTDGGVTWANETTFQTGTSDTLLLSSSIGLNGWRFRNIYTNSAGRDTTDVAVLTTAQNYVTSQPTDQTVCDGATVTFSHGIYGVGAPVYSWEESVAGGPFTAIPGAASQTLSFVADLSKNGNRYRMVLTNGPCGSVTSNAVLLTVTQPPSITTQPQSLTVCAGSTATFSAAATASTAPSWVWQESSDGGASWFDVAGENSVYSSSRTFTVLLTDDGHRYRAIVTDGSCADTTDEATLTVGSPSTLSVTLDRTVLTGGTRALMPIVATVSTSGGCSPQVVLDEIISSDPDAGMDAGDIAGDIVVDSLDVTPAETAFQLRAEAGAAGRTYTVIYRLTDGSYTALDTTTVAVLPPGSTLGGAPLPTTFTLDEASPNPATSSTSFSFASNSGATCGGKVVIYATSGLPVKYLQTNYLGAGTTLTWDLTNNAGVRVPNGTYIYEVRFCQQIARGAIIVQ